MKRKSVRGVITILVSLSLVGILSLGTLVLEVGRYQTANTQLMEANSSAATSMIASFDADLYERYGLLAIDKEKFNTARYMDYLIYNSDQMANFEGTNVSQLYSVESVELQGLYNLTYPSVLKRQILTRARYHVVPQDQGLNVYNMDSFLSDLQKKCRYIVDILEPAATGYASDGSVADVPVGMQQVIEQLYQEEIELKWADENCNSMISGYAQSLLPSTTGTVESQPIQSDAVSVDATVTDAIQEIGGEGALLGASAMETVNEVDVYVDTTFVRQTQEKLKDLKTANNLPFQSWQVAVDIRNMAKQMDGAITALSNQRESNMLLNAYISEYFSSRNNTVVGYMGPERGKLSSLENGTFAAACVEYIFGGSGSEISNQERACDYLMAIRLICNLYTVMRTSNSFDGNNLHSVAAHIAWAYYESAIDMVLIAENNVAVPVNKEKLFLPVNTPEQVDGLFVGWDVTQALDRLGFVDRQNYRFQIYGSYPCDYQDYLAVGLWFVPNSQKMLRIADLIQLEMRYRQQYVNRETATFLMSEQNTYCRALCTGKLNSVLPVLALGTDVQIDGLQFHSIKYAGY